ncbi:hypothetical protein ACWCPQ_16995 [Nocardia sp. NPDC001965]
MRKDSRPFITINVDMPRHPRFASLSKAQKWTIVEAWCHCGEYLTDGVIDAATWRGLATKRDRDAILATGAAIEFRKGQPVAQSNGFQQDFSKIRSDFESATGRPLPADCVIFPGWMDHQRTRSDVEEMKEKRRSAGQKGGQAKARNATKQGSGNVASATADAYQTPTKNVPDTDAYTEVTTNVVTPPNPPEGATAPRPVSVDPAGFVEFWAAYPRRTDKGGARKAYAKAARKVDPSVIVAAARRLADDPNLPEPRFIPHPSTWLNGERWDDGPLPSRFASAAPADGRPTLTPGEMKFARAEALKSNPDPRILAAAGIPMPEPRATVTALDEWSRTALEIGEAS